MSIDYTKLTTDTGFAEYLKQSLNIRLPLLYKIAKKEGINSLNPSEQRELFAEYKNYLRQAKKTCFPEKQGLWTRVKQKLKQAASVFKEFPFIQINIEKNAGNVDRIISDLFLNKGYKLLGEFDYKNEGKVYVFKSPSGKVLSIPHHKLLELKDSNLVLDFIDQSAEWTQKVLENVNFVHINPEKRKEFFSLLTSGGERGSSKDIRDSLLAGTIDGLTLGAGQTIINAALNPAGVASFSLNPVRSYEQIKAQREQAKKQGDYYTLGQIDGTNIALALLALKGGAKGIFESSKRGLKEKSESPGIVFSEEKPAPEAVITEEMAEALKRTQRTVLSDGFKNIAPEEFEFPKTTRQKIEAFLKDPKKTLQDLKTLYKLNIAKRSLFHKLTVIEREIRSIRRDISDLRKIVNRKAVSLKSAIEMFLVESDLFRRRLNLLESKINKFENLLDKMKPSNFENLKVKLKFIRKKIDVIKSTKDRRIKTTELARLDTDFSSLQSMVKKSFEVKSQKTLLPEREPQKTPQTKPVPSKTGVPEAIEKIPEIDVTTRKPDNTSLAQAESAVRKTTSPKATRKPPKPIGKTKQKPTSLSVAAESKSPKTESVVKLEVIKTERFSKGLEKLAETEKNRVKRAIILLAQNPRHPSLRTSKIKMTKDWFECKVSLRGTALRIFYRIENHNIILEFAGRHQDAEKFIRNIIERIY